MCEQVTVEQCVDVFKANTVFSFSASAGFSHFAWQRVRAFFAVEDGLFVGQFFYVWHAAVTTPRGAGGALDLFK